MSTLAVKSTRSSVKAKALRALRNLPATATWDDVMHHLYVRQKIEAGLADVSASRTHSHTSIRKEFGLGA